MSAVVNYCNDKQCQLWALHLYPYLSHQFYQFSPLLPLYTEGSYHEDRYNRRSQSERGPFKLSTTGSQSPKDDTLLLAYEGIFLDLPNDIWIIISSFHMLITLSLHLNQLIRPKLWTVLTKTQTPVFVADAWKPFFIACTSPAHPVTNSVSTVSTTVRKSNETFPNQLDEEIRNLQWRKQTHNQLATLETTLYHNWWRGKVFACEI